MLLLACNLPLGRKKDVNVWIDNLWQTTCVPIIAPSNIYKVTFRPPQGYATQQP